MKTKKLNKKLTLSKKTVTNLDNSELNVVKGGQPTGPANCPTFLICFTPETGVSWCGC